MALNNQKNLVIAAVVFLLAAVGAAAWIHNTGTRPLAAPAAVIEANSQYAPSAQPYSASYASAPAVSTGDGYYPTMQRPVYIRQPEAGYPGPGEPQSFEGQDTEGQYTEVRRLGPRTYREYHHGRSKKHSVEIVAGTAAAGAAIGAIAGGGKGAAIGGISGAGAGFIYDRTTHNH